jgi:membrane associated rhomboid family serine protease
MPRDLRSADEKDGVERLRHPPPWWVFQVLVVAPGVLFSLLDKSNAAFTALIGVVAGLACYSHYYADGERALISRLDMRIAQMQLQIDALADERRNK